MRPIFLAVMVLCLASSEVTAQELKFAKGRPVDLQHLKLELDVDLKKRTVKGRAHWRLAVLQATTELRFDAVDFEVSGVKISSKGGLSRVPFSNNGREILIHTRELRRGSKVNVVIDYKVTEPKSGLSFFSPSAEDPDVPLQVWSQGEAEMNRYWIPCIDHPNERQSTELIITVDKGLFALSNGKKVSKKDKGDKTVYHWRQDKSHVIYLVTLVVGQFEEVTDSWRGKPLTYYVPFGWKKHALNSFKNTKRMLNFFSDRIGQEYPWDRYDQIVVEQFAHGGMENTGATTLNESTLHDARAHIDFSSDGLVAHELAHQWFGDLLTCRDWAHIWLNEGFATYFEALWDEENNGRDSFLYNMWNKARSGRNAGKSLPILDRRYREPSAVFDGRAYPKGSWVLHQLRRRIGDKAFWAGIRLYVQRHKYSTVDTSDLRKAFEDATGHSLERFFYDTVERKGHPVLDVRFRWLSKENLLEVDVKQRQKEPAFHFPVTIQAQLKGSKNKQLRQRFQVTKKHQQFYLSLGSRPSMVRFDPLNTVLKEAKIHKDQDWWIAQLTSDKDPIGRIEAAQDLARRRRGELTKTVIDALFGDKFWAVKVEVAKALAKIGGAPVRDALILGLKQKNPRVRRACADGLGTFKKDQKAAVALETVIKKGDASYYVESSAISSFAKVKGPQSRDLLLNQLTKHSHRDTIADQSLRALARHKDLNNIDLFLKYSHGPVSARLRRTALGALGTLGSLAACSKKDKARIVARLKQCLEGGSYRIRREALSALRTMGRNASTLIPLLELLASHDPNSRIRQGATEAIAKLRSGRPALPEIERLRKEFKALKKAHEDQKKRLEKLTAQLEKKGSQ
jgi:aminopeptidase N